MNTIAGTITLAGDTVITDEFDFDSVESLSLNGLKTIYFFGETELETTQSFIEENKAILGDFLFHDISISSEDKVFLEPFDYEEGIYEVASFEGEHISFKEVQERFDDVAEAISIRECEISKRFGNRIIRVDFVY